MRRPLILCSLALIAAVLAFTLAILQSGSNVLCDSDVPTAAPAPAEAAYRMLYTRSQQDFAAMTVTLSSGEAYTVESSLGFDENGNLLGVYNSLGQPVTVAGQPSFALDSISYQMMLLTAVNLPVTASYPGLDPEACGLTAPVARIEITYHMGAPIILTIGKPTASGYSCYVQMDGDSSVHLAPIDFYEVMTRPLNDHHRLPGAIRASAAVQIAVVRPGSDNFIATNYGSEGRILPWQVDQPYVHAGSTERIQAFVDTVCAIHADSYAASVSSAQELAAYGLDAPTRLLVAFSDGSIRDIHLGGDAGDGMLYARLDTSADVYRVSTAQLPPLDKSGTDMLLDRFVTLISAGDVATVAVLAGEQAWLLNITQDAEGDLVYAINGEGVAGDVFAPVYTAIVGMQFDKTAESAPAGDMICEVRFLHGDGTLTRVAYHSFDPHYVQADTSGGGQFLLRRERLESMLDALKEALP